MKGKGVFKRVYLILFCAVFFCFSAPIKARALSNSFCICIEGKNYFYYYPQLNYGLKGASIYGLDGVVEELYLNSRIPPKNATLNFNPELESPFIITEEKSGLAINKKKLKAKIEYALNAGITKVEIKREIVYPEITKEYLQKQTFLRGEFTTEYPYSSSERKHNISLATSFISGKIVKSGQSFSFNQTVGERSEGRGFLPAKVISYGQFTEGVGGGVCQVSTTLYNALLLSGLKITECNRHSLAVGYVPPSFDAMVSYGVSDLKFVNDTPYDIYLSGVADGQKLTFKVYGEAPFYKYKLHSVVTEILPATTKTLKKVTGEELDVLPKDGLKSEGYVYYYKGEELVQIKKIRSDTYKPVDGIFYEE